MLDGVRPRANRSPLTRTVLLLIGLTSLTSCTWLSRFLKAPPPAAPPPVAAEIEAPATARRCALVGGQPRPGGTLRIALADSVHAAHAPVPRNASERLAFRNAYQSLVDVSCDGAILPALADAWTPSEGGRVWIFRCHPGARFSDSTACGAPEVVASWQEGRRRALDSGDRYPWIWFDALDITATALNDTVLIVTLSEAREDLPRILAHPAFAVTKPGRSGGFPFGTGPFRIAASSSDPATSLALVRNPHFAGEAPFLEKISLRVRAGEDERDLLGSDVDAMLVLDKAALDYARSLTDYDVTEMLPDRLYVLLSPVRGVADSAGRGNGQGPPAWRSAEFARDVVRAAAAPATRFGFTADAGGSCAIPVAGAATTERAADGASAGEPLAPPSGDTIANPPPAVSGGLRIGYPEGDAFARQLAERIAALATAPDEPAATVSGLPSDEYELAVRDGTGPCVVRVERAYSAPYLEIGELVDRAGWLARLAYGGSLDAGRTGAAAARLVDGSAFGAELRRAGAASPLVLLQSHLVAKRGLAGARLAFDNAVLLDRAGWAGAREVP